MHVLAMLHAYVPGHNAGAEWAAHALLRELAARGHTVDVLLSRADAGREAYDVDGVTVHPHRGKNDVVPWLAGPGRADVIVTHLENTARASLLGQQHAIHVVHLLHNTFPKSKEWLVKGTPSLAVYNTEWMRDDAEAWWRVNRGERQMPQGLVVHPPVAGADYATTPGDHVTLINLTVEKGAGVFYALAERMPKRRFLGVIGGYGTQVVRDDLPNVEIVDHTPGHLMRERVYGRTRVLLAPSVYESYGRVAVEAMCSGIPVVAHPTPGLKEACGDAGVFVDRDDVDAWERQVTRLFSPKVYPAAKKAALARAAALDPGSELDMWCRTVEGVAARARTR
ncbi:glycosyltransferase family 4 protein [Streptomyces synnematoformans]|uniref:Glycosyltransferase n=1 Tax=Streptomyces synnematoformans TaxID=415721 RepID=A0ABP5J0X9_9ACTN